MSPQNRERLEHIRDAFNQGHIDGWTRSDIEFLLDLVPAGIDHQIDNAAEQIIVDCQRLDQAAKIIGSPVSLEQATDFAINWCATAMQEACNADYYKERAQAAERLNAFKEKKT
jgi:hypothetical protein